MSEEALRRSDVFQGLNDEQFARVAALARPVRFSPGDEIVSEDERGSRCFALVRGRVEVEVRGPLPDGSPHRLATLASGQLFGELSLVDGYLRSATVRAVDEVEALCFENRELDALMEDDPLLGYRVMRNLANRLAQRIRDTNMRLRNAMADILAG